MAGPVNVGFFGKLPSAGDFVQRRLPATFVDNWDRSFEHAVAASRQALGSDWNSAYRSSPVWRLVLGQGVCGPSGWAGVMGPGVDRVGRCFPLVIACDLGPDPASPAKALALGHWFDAAERVLNGALSTQASPVEQFDRQVASLAHGFGQPPSDFAWLREVDIVSDRHWRLPLPTAGTLSSSYLQTAWQRMTNVRSGALWWTRGAGRVPPTVLMTAGLPQPQAYVAFIDAAAAGEPWQTRGDFAAVPVSAPATPAAAAIPNPALPGGRPAIDAGPAGSPEALVTPAPIADDLSDLFPDAPAAASPLAVAGNRSLLDPDATVPIARASAPSAPAAVPPPPASPSAGSTRAAIGAAAHAAPCARLRTPDGRLTLIACDAGGHDVRQRAAATVAIALDDLPEHGDAPAIDWLRQRLIALHAPLRDAASDLIDPIQADCAVVAARLASGQAELLAIGAAQTWLIRGGQAPTPLLGSAMPTSALPGGDDLDDLLFGAAPSTAAGLGAAATPTCLSARCDVRAGDRLVLASSADLLARLPSLLTAPWFEVPAGRDAQALLAAAAGLPTDPSTWPFAVIEV